MPLFMYKFRYTAEARAEFIRKPEDRGAVVDEMLKNVGGRLVTIYYTSGEWDGLVIFEALDEITAQAAVIAIVAPGHIMETERTMLFTTVPDMINALGTAKMLRFRGMAGRGLPLEEPPLI